MNPYVCEHLRCLKRKISNGYVRKKRNEIILLRDQDSINDEDELDLLNTAFDDRNIQMFRLVIEAKLEILMDNLGKLSK